jgi:hypothetical protein
VTARTFEDSAGTVWEVFEVQRSSQKAQAVSAGLEQGWLAFASETGKRRLAPYPSAWRTADSAELERLCGLARLARNTGMALMARSAGAGDARAVGVAADATETQARMRVPRIRPPRTTAAGEAVSSSGELPIMTAATSADTVESTVREFARQARARHLPAIEAMVQLKALLARVYTDSASVARDLRAVRRWFVEAYYFDRDTEQPGAPDQSR